MAETVYNMMTAVFGPGLLEKISDFMTMVVDVLDGAFKSGGGVATAMGIFMGIGVSLMIIFFYADLATQASRDMLTLDRLMVMFIKLIISLCLILYCRELISGSFSFIKGMYQLALNNVYTASEDSENPNITYWGNKTWPGYTTVVLLGIGETQDSGTINYNKSKYNEYDKALGDNDSVTYNNLTLNRNSDGSISAVPTSGNAEKYYQGGQSNTSGEGKTGKTTVKDHLEDEHVVGTGLKGVFNGLPIVLMLLLPYIICTVCTFAAYFICISNAIMLLIYGVYAPIAMAQCFDEVQRSVGIRYLKKFIATGLSFGIIVVCLWAGSYFQGAIGGLIASGTGSGGRISIDDTTIQSIFGNFKLIAVIVAIQFATIGAMFKGSQIANDMLGA